MIVGHKDEVDHKRRKMPKILQVNKLIGLDGDLICYTVGGFHRLVELAFLLHQLHSYGTYRTFQKVALSMLP